jgi:hypothetical protein
MQYVDSILNTKIVTAAFLNCLKSKMRFVRDLISRWSCSINLSKAPIRHRAFLAEVRAFETTGDMSLDGPEIAC